MNLIEMLKNEVTSGVVSSLSRKSGLTEDHVKSGFSTGIPAVLAGILKNGANPGFIGKILTNGERNEEDLLNTSNDSLLEKGSSLASDLFGKETNTVTNSISSSTGLSVEKSSGLLAMVIPMITGFISKIMSNNGWGVTDLLSKIYESKSAISASLPAGLSDSLGLANINMPNINMPKMDMPKSGIPKSNPINYDKVQDPKSSNGFLKWLIPLLIILIGLWWIMGQPGCNKSKMTLSSDSLSTTVDTMGKIDTSKSTITGVLNEAGDFVRDLGAIITKKLPDGNEIMIAENSAENHLISFIEDKNKAVDKTTWFTLDRLYFDSGKSTLKTESQGQLKNIAAILKAYPSVKLKLGGYTDNTGDAKMNINLSNDRAKSALQELVKLGIDVKRLEAEGYGPEHPIASNEIAVGKAQNRRIDIRITQK